MTRRTALSLLALAPQLHSQPARPRPFKIEVPQATLDRILNRVRDTRFPAKLEAPDWRYGANWDYLRALADYWTSRYNWRTAEAALNRYPQFMARVGDFDIHFYHLRGVGPRPMPLILTHGWPGSMFEFLEAIGPLSDPARYGGSPADAFDVIVPSLPGFGFSSKPAGKPVGPVTTARLWHELMTGVLGYPRYGAQGGDWGMAVSTALARLYPQELVGIHLNAANTGPAPAGQASEEEQAWQRAATAYRAAELDYFNEQQRKPQTVAFALADNPVGTAAWIAEKLKVWSDSTDDLDSAFTKDQVLTNIMIYLVTESSATGVWFYRGSADEPPAGPAGKLATPTGFAAFPKEMAALAPPRSALERAFNLVHYTKMPRGGHFACLEEPELFVADVRTFFRPLRG